MVKDLDSRRSRLAYDKDHGEKDAAGKPSLLPREQDDRHQQSEQSDPSGHSPYKPQQFRRPGLFREYLKYHPRYGDPSR